MLRKISLIGAQTRFSELVSCYKSIFINQEEDFAKSISDYLPSGYVYLAGSGTASFYIILKTLKEFSVKKEVILPAYTAPAVVLPVLEAGLRPVLCDISFSDFNIDLNLLSGVITEDTLCIVPTHIFGIVVSGIEKLRQRMQKIYIVEDCAQAMGSMLSGKNVGSFCDIGFLSFNRGKNLSTYGGGCIFTNSGELAEKMNIHLYGLKERNTFLRFILPFKMMSFSFAVRPYVFGPFYNIVSHFKDNKVPVSFCVERYTNFQANLGLNQLKKIEWFSKRRYENGITLINGLSGIKGIMVPVISKDIRPAFNRLPVLFKNLDLREKAEKALFRAGIDTSRMYLKPIHHIFNLGYKKEDFPNAIYFAERVLTLPVHPYLRGQDINKIISIIKEVMA